MLIADTAREKFGFDTSPLADLIHWGDIIDGAQFPTPESAVELRLGPIKVPCRVVYVVDEPTRQGFAYGTLPGHPERGEEALVIDRNDDGSVSFSVTAFSRHATLLTRLGGPVGRLAQNFVTERYLGALG